MAFMRVPSLEEDFGRDAAMGLNDLGWGKDLLVRALGRDEEGRLVSAPGHVSHSNTDKETLLVSTAQAMIEQLFSRSSLSHATTVTSEDTHRGPSPEITRGSIHSLCTQY